MRRVASVSCVAVFLVCVLACTGGKTLTTATNADGTRKAAPELTMAKYEAVKTDMTYEQACQVIGFAGEESSRNSIGGTETVLYIWHGGFGANMNATFQNNRLVSKAQFGLK